MRRFFVRLFAIIGGVVFCLAIIGIAIGVWVHIAQHRVADNTILTLDLAGSFPDAPPSSGLTSLISQEQPSVIDVIDALQRAGGDARIKGLVAHIGGGEMGLAQVQELRDAIAAFRATGKPAYAYADSFGEFGSGTRGYYLATAFDEIWLQPLGMVGLVGLRAEMPFFRGALDKLGILPRFDHREEYKTAMNELTETAMTAPHREETEAIIASIFDQIENGIAADRKLDPAKVHSIIDHGPLMTQEAVDAHLIDHVGYRDEVVAALRTKIGSAAHLRSLTKYFDDTGSPHDNGPTIALIYASGLITGGSGDSNPLSQSSTVGADQIIRAFRLAEKDKAVKAILFRIDSPGGSAVASESIWRETVRAKQAGKPLIVSMGDVAGSGGYYIAAAADKIVAEPATLTGSIGVLAGKVLIGGLSEKLGVTWDSAQMGKNAGMSSMVEDFSPEGHERFEAFLDQVYAGFKQRVADGRNLDAETVEAVAKGRVWTGVDAQPRKLVDALGGYTTALDLAKQAAAIPAEDEVTVKLYPPARDPVSVLISRAMGRGDDEEDNPQASTIARSLALLQPLVAQLEILTAPPGSLVMTAPDLR